MDELRQIRAQLSQVPNGSNNDEFKADCFLADLELEQLEMFLRDRLEYREVHMRVARRRFSGDRPTLCNSKIPQLFRDGVPTNDCSCGISNIEC